MSSFQTSTKHSITNNDSNKDPHPVSVSWVLGYFLNTCALKVFDDRITTTTAARSHLQYHLHNGVTSTTVRRLNRMPGIIWLVFDICTRS
eukprot:scaffold3922_cov85-Skeletonema_dohrnii-CCMP3373.AAC.5